MIAEKDAEKLDSIKPSEIEKLGAMQDPKDATAGYVLTAVSGGKAEYRAQKSVAIGEISNNFSNVKIKTDATGTYLSISIGGAKIINAMLREELKMGGTTTIDLGLVSVIVWRAKYTNQQNELRIYFSPEAITRYSITEDSTFSGSYFTVYH